MKRKTKASTAKTAWKNRIVGYGEDAPKNLLANPLNHRIHPGEQAEALGMMMGNVGVTAPVIVNKRTGHIVDGHLRVALAIKTKQPMVQIAFVDLDEREEAQVLATFDAIGDLATINNDTLTALLDSASFDDEQLAILTAALELPTGESENILREVINNKYTGKVVTPVYKPVGDSPSIKDLCDQGKTSQLVNAVKESGLDDDQKAFLRAAAQRHTVFDYKAIAEYYCHASPEMQQAMEASGLVIIDFDKAIENGYVKMTERMMQLSGGDEDDDAS